MATINIVDQAEMEAVRRELAEMRQMVELCLSMLDEEVDTATALRITGLKSRNTLTQLRGEGEGQISYRKIGRKARYSRQSCLEFKQRRLRH